MAAGVCERHSLGVFDEPVVLGVENVVDSGQADVLVGAAVAGDEVRVEQFVVILAIGRRIVGIAQADFDVAVGEAGRHGAMGDVGEEGMAGADGAGGENAQPTIGGGVALDEERRVTGIKAGEHHLGVAIGAGDEIAVLIGGKQRDIADVWSRSAGCPEGLLACALTSAHVAMPPFTPSISLPVETGSPAAFSA